MGEAVTAEVISAVALGVSTGVTSGEAAGEVVNAFSGVHPARKIKINRKMFQRMLCPD